MTKKSKSISNGQLAVTIIILAVIAAFILISSGIFNSPEVGAQQKVNNVQNSTEPSVDLNVINEINNLEEVVKNNPNDHQSLIKLGHLLNDNGFYERAIQKYEKYLSMHPNEADVIVDMGVCYFELRKYDKSIEVIKRALKINPKHQIANFNLGIVYFAKQNNEEAKSYWAKARDIDPTSNIGKKAEELIKSNN